MKRKKNKNHKKNLKLILRIASLFLVFGLFVIAYLYLPRLIIIREVECKSQFGPCNEIVNYNINQVVGINMKDANRLINDYLTSNVLVKEYKTEFRAPDVLLINIIEKKPNYALKVDEDKFLLIDSEGYVIALDESTNLPFIEVNNMWEVAEKVDDDILFALDLVYEVNNSLEISKAEIVEDRLEVTLENSILVLFPLEGDKNLLAGSLSLILSRLNKEEGETRIEDVQEVEIIDLRFNNPVIK